MGKQATNLQDVFLNASRKLKMELTIYLMNGVPVHGKVISFDSFTILLKVDKKQNLIYKHAISTIVPATPINLAENEQ